MTEAENSILCGKSHWTENPVGLSEVGWWGRFLVGGDEHGDYVVPKSSRAVWFHRLNLWKPWHWPSYLLTRLTNKHIWVEHANVR